jgi:hypothetical protein
MIGKDFHGRRQLRALFGWCGARYRLAVTDVEFERRMRDLPNGLHPFHAAGLPLTSTIYLLISLGEPLEGVCYKLVAGLIAIETAGPMGVAQA